MGVSIEECLELKALAEERGCVLQIGHMKRFDEGLQYAKQFCAEKMGDITTYKGWYCDSVGRYTLTDNCMPVLYASDSAKKPVGNPKAVLDHYYLLGHGSHLFDTALYLVGDIARVLAATATVARSTRGSSTAASQTVPSAPSTSPSPSHSAGTRAARSTARTERCSPRSSIRGSCAPPM